MTLTPENFPPKFLYKYRSGSDLDLATLRKGKVFVPNFYTLNDIFESNFEFELSHALENANIFMPVVSRNEFGEPVFVPTMFARRISGEELNQHRRDLKKAIQEKRKQIFNKGVYSLSASNNIELMWAHYADSYKGYCIEFDLDHSDDLSPEFAGPFGILYVEKPPKIEWFLVDEYPERSLWYRMIGHKSENWKHEEECRLIYNKGHLEYDIPFKVNAIIFGPKSSEDLKKSLFDIFGDDIEYKECICDSGKYKLRIVESRGPA